MNSYMKMGKNAIKEEWTNKLIKRGMNESMKKRGIN